MPIVVEKLNHAYMEGSTLAHDALKDVTLTIGDGEFLGLIGHTGSGKSTFVQHLNGLLQPTSGSVTVDGFDMADKKPVSYTHLDVYKRQPLQYAPAPQREGDQA